MGKEEPKRVFLQIEASIESAIIITFIKVISFLIKFHSLSLINREVTDRHNRKSQDSKF
jgi:hypothetical protein